MTNIIYRLAGVLGGVSYPPSARDAAGVCLTDFLNLHCDPAASLRLSAAPNSQAVMHLLAQCTAETHVADGNGRIATIRALIIRIAATANKAELMKRREENAPAQPALSDLPLLGATLAFLSRPFEPASTPNDGCIDSSSSSSSSSSLVVGSARCCASGLASLLIESIRIATNTPTPAAVAVAGKGEEQQNEPCTHTTLLQTLQSYIISILTRTHPLEIQECIHATLLTHLQQLPPESFAESNRHQIDPVTRIVGHGLQRIFTRPDGDKGAALNIAACFQQAAASASSAALRQSRLEAESLSANPESHAIITADLLGLARLAEWLCSATIPSSTSSVSVSASIDSVRSDLTSLVSHLLNPWHLNHYLRGGPKRASFPPIACIAAFLAPTFEWLSECFATSAPASSRSSSLWRRIADAARHALIEPQLQPQQTLSARVRKTPPPRMLVHGHHSNTPLACCLVLTTAGRINSQTTNSTTADSSTSSNNDGDNAATDDAYLRSTLTCLSLESASLMRLIVFESVHRKRLTPFDPSDLPRSIQIGTTFHFEITQTPISMLECMKRSIQELNADSLRGLERPCWISLTAGCEIIRAIRDEIERCATNDATLPSNDQRAQLLALSVELLFSLSPTLTRPSSSCPTHVGLSCGLPNHPLPTRVQTECWRRSYPDEQGEGEEHTPTAPAPCASPVTLHIHATPWLAILREEITELKAVGDEKRYITLFMARIKTEILKLIKLLVSTVSANESSQPIWLEHLFGRFASDSFISSLTSAPAPPLSSILAPLLVSLFWFELRLHANLTPPTETILMHATFFDVIEQLVPPRVDALTDDHPPIDPVELAAIDRVFDSNPTIGLSELASCGLSTSILTSTMLMRVMSSWIVKPITLCTRMHQFILTRMTLYDDGIDMNDAPIESVPSLYDPPPQLDSCALQFTDAAISGAVEHVHEALEKLRAHQLGTTTKGGSAHRDDDDEEEEEDVEEDDSGSDAPAASSLPTWVDPSGPSPYVGLDSIPSDLVVGFRVDSFDGEFHPTVKEAKESAPRRRFDRDVAAPIALMRIHTLWIRDVVTKRGKLLAKHIQSIRSEVDSTHALARKAAQLQRQAADAAEAEQRALARQHAATIKQQLQEQAILLGRPKSSIKKSTRAIHQATSIDNDNEMEIDIDDDANEPHDERGDAQESMADVMTPVDPMTRSTLEAHTDTPVPDRVCASTQFIADMILRLVLASPASVDDPDLPSVGWVSLLDLGPGRDSSIPRRKRSKGAILPSTDATMSDAAPRLTAIKEIVSTIMRTIDACMDTCDKEIGALLATYQMQTRDGTLLPSVEFNSTILTSLSSIHSTLATLVRLHALFPDDSLDSFASLIVGADRSIAGLRVVLTAQHTLDNSEAIDQIEQIEEIIQTHRTKAREHMALQQKKRKRAALLYLDDEEDGDFDDSDVGSHPASAGVSSVAALLSPSSRPPTRSHSRPSPSSSVSSMSRRSPPASGTSSRPSRRSRKNASRQYRTSVLTQWSIEDGQLSDPEWNGEEYPDLDDGFIVPDEVI